MEATILKWLKQVGDTIEEDEIIVEIATDKVDSEIPSPVSGTIESLLYGEGDTVSIGQTIARIQTGATDHIEEKNEPLEIEADVPEEVEPTQEPVTVKPPTPIARPLPQNDTSSVPTERKFYSPLVRNIAKKENISTDDLDQIAGSGLDGRVTKADLMAYIEKKAHIQEPKPVSSAHKVPKEQMVETVSRSYAQPSENEEIIEMDRMRKLIAQHMVDSKRISPHVTSFVEADVTNIVSWRKANKMSFEQKYGTKLTYTPVFIDAVVKAIHDFPRINSSVRDDAIVLKKSINIGMATAMDDGNLIVPVISNADHLNLVGLAKQVNDLASRARSNQLKPDEIQGGTFTVTNVGTFGNVMGTPIINQPQAAILAIGAIRKKPDVVETDEGDVIGIRQKMFLSLSYDHRIIDGFLGGSFLRKVADYLEQFDLHAAI